MSNCEAGRTLGRHLVVYYRAQALGRSWVVHSARSVEKHIWGYCQYSASSHSKSVVVAEEAALQARLSKQKWSSLTRLPQCSEDRRYSDDLHYFPSTETPLGSKRLIVELLLVHNSSRTKRYCSSQEPSTLEFDSGKKRVTKLLVASEKVWIDRMERCQRAWVVTSERG